MKPRLLFRSWWRMDRPGPPPSPRRARNNLWWFAAYWMIGLGAAAAMELDLIPVRSWVNGTQAQP